MSDPFRRIFLDQVELIVQKEPSRESLLALLQLATPGLVSLGCTDDTQRMFRTLLARVHPDKHPQDPTRATRLCQGVQSFYRKCLSSPRTGRPSKRAKSSPRNASFPFEFNAAEKWPHIVPSRHPGGTERQTARAVAYQCMNARGAIAHGRIPEKTFDVCDTDAVASVEQVFNAHGGTKELNGPDDIKEELMKNGPVVSTSFNPNVAFMGLNAAEGAANQRNNLLIIGWKQLSSGEVWIVQPLHRNVDGFGTRINPSSHIAVGQFGIDDCCLAPMNSFENVPWQKGPYYDAHINEDQADWWIQSSSTDGTMNQNKSMSVEVSSMSELDALFKERGTTSFLGSITNQQLAGLPNSNTITVTVRDRLKKAHSRRATLASIRWDVEKGRFAIQFDFHEKGTSAIGDLLKKLNKKGTGMNVPGNTYPFGNTSAQQNTNFWQQAGYQQPGWNVGPPY